MAQVHLQTALSIVARKKSLSCSKRSFPKCRPMRNRKRAAMHPETPIGELRPPHVISSRTDTFCRGKSRWLELSLNVELLRSGNVLVIVSLPRDFRGVIKIESRRRRSRHPFQAGSAPGVGVGNFSVAHRPQEIHHREKVSDRENGGTGSGEHVQHLEFRRILPVPARHSQVAKDELREKCQVEADKHDHRSQPAPSLGIHSAGNFRPPEVHAAKVAHHRSPHHDVVEMCNDEISISHVHIDAERGHEQSGQPAHSEQADKSERVEHGGGWPRFPNCNLRSSWPYTLMPPNWRQRARSPEDEVLSDESLSPRLVDCSIFSPTPKVLFEMGLLAQAISGFSRFRRSCCASRRQFAVYSDVVQDGRSGVRGPDDGSAVRRRRSYRSRMIKCLGTGQFSNGWHCAEAPNSNLIWIIA